MNTPELAPELPRMEINRVVFFPIDVPHDSWLQLNTNLLDLIKWANWVVKRCYTWMVKKKNKRRMLMHLREAHSSKSWARSCNMSFHSSCKHKAWLKAESFCFWRDKNQPNTKVYISAKGQSEYIQSKCRYKYRNFKSYHYVSVQDLQYLPESSESSRGH